MKNRQTLKSRTDKTDKTSRRRDGKLGRNSAHSILARIAADELHMRNLPHPQGPRALTDFEQRVRNRKAVFEIDAFFQSRSELLKPEFGAEVRRDWLRQSVDAAFSAALSGVQERDGSWAIGQWERGKSCASEAADALGRLLQWMGAPNPPYKTIEDRKNAAQAIMRAVWLGSGERQAENAAENTASAALALVEAHSAASDIAKEFERHAKSLAAQNIGEPEKQRFVMSLAESWVFLCGKVHSVGNSNSATPFRAFVDAAWQDIGGRDQDPDDTESFIWQIRKAAAQLKEKQNTDPLPNRPFWFAWDEQAWWIETPPKK